VRAELRQVKASMYAGLTDIVFGLIMYFTKAADWYFAHFHFFGILGIGMVFYSVWLYYFFALDTQDNPTLKKALKEYP